MKRYILYILIFISISTYAQKSEDALRFSQRNYLSTARSAAMGGAFGALGADFHAVGINPAGLAIYRHNEFSFSTGLSLINSEQRVSASNGQYFNINKDISSWNPGHMNAVIILNNNNTNNENFGNLVIGFGYRQLNNFDKESINRVNNSPSSFLDYLGIRGVGDLNSGYEDVNPFSAGLFEKVHLLQINNNGFSTGLETNELLNQTKKIIESGYQGEYEFSIAKNFNRELYIGASLGIQRLNYQYSSSYNEQTIGNNNEFVNNYSFLEYVKQSGYGVNIKLGIIYKPKQNISLGLAFDSGTNIEIDEEYYTTAVANYNKDVSGSKQHIAKSDVSDFDYTLKTPLKLTLSGAYIFGQRALISTDIEYINYSRGRFEKDNNENEFADINSETDETYKGVINFRIGGEYRLNSLISLRAGYAYEDSPYKNGFINDNNYKNIFSGGFGFNIQNIYCNLAYVNTKYNNSFVFYNIEDPTYGTSISSIIEQKISNNDFILSFGIKF